MTEHMPPAVAAYLERTGHGEARLVPLTGDASDRRYIRVITGSTSIVLAVHSEPFDAAALPFVNVSGLFAAMPVPVPRVLGHAGDLGVVALEDLGDVTLQAHLGTTDVARHDALYREAVSLIEVLQRRGAELSDPAWTPYGVTFDVQKLTWELDFFLRHFVVAYRGALPDAAELAALADEWRTIATELAAESRVLCHRDYHSRNLMWHRDRLVMIDYQDARLGPDTYDLASLLRDSYVDVTESAVDGLLSYYLALTGRSAESAAFRVRFDLMSVQRNLKALGTFGYQTTARGNTVYIQYIPRTLRLVRENLRKYTRFGRLQEILARHVAELG